MLSCFVSLEVASCHLPVFLTHFCSLGPETLVQPQQRIHVSRLRVIGPGTCISCITSEVISNYFVSTSSIFDLLYPAMSLSVFPNSVYSPAHFITPFIFMAELINCV